MRLSRRTFVRMLPLPAFAALWPRAVQAQAQPGYSDSDGRSDAELAAAFLSRIGVSYAA